MRLPWNDRTNSPVNMEQVCAMFERGGLQLLDLEVCNNVIDVMWLKVYLDFSANRPTWTYVMDDIFTRTVTIDCSAKDKSMCINPFLQNWKPKMTALAQPLQALIKVSWKYNLRAEGLAFSQEILRGMPMWYHVYADSQEMNKQTRISSTV